MVTAYDFESDRPSWNPEWVPIKYEASITAQHSSTLGTRAAEPITGASELIVGCSLEVCSATPSVVSSGRNKVNSTA